MFLDFETDTNFTGIVSVISSNSSCKANMHGSPYLINNVEDIVVFLGSTVFNSYMLSWSKIAQVTFVRNNIAS